MDRPYIICHMLVSYNNKISGGKDISKLVPPAD